MSKARHESDDFTSGTIACEQALLLGESQEVTREPHTEGDASVRGGERKESSPFSPPLVVRAFSRGSLRLPLKWRASSKASGTRDVDPHGRL